MVAELKRTRNAGRRGEVHQLAAFAIAILAYLLLSSLSWLWSFLSLPWQVLMYAVSRIANIRLVGPEIPQEAQRTIRRLQARVHRRDATIKEGLQQLDEAKRTIRRLETMLPKGKAAPLPAFGSWHAGNSKAATPPSRLGMHLAFWLGGVLPACWLAQQHHVPVINRRFAKILLYPEAFFYCMEILGAGGTPNCRIVATTSTFLSGFVLSHWL